MRVVRFAVTGLVLTLGLCVAAEGCGLGVLDVPTGTTIEPGTDASSTRQDSGELVPEPVTDSGSTDGSLDDAGGDAGGPDGSVAGECPLQCSSCTNGECVIECPGPKCPSVILGCPPGMPCRLLCREDKACESMLVGCPSSYACTVRCLKAGACDKLTINASNSTRLCLDCRGNEGCKNFDCSVPPQCSRSCGVNGDNDNACQNIEACGNCAAAAGDCP